jgi:hypothetical protein
MLSTLDVPLIELSAGNGISDTDGTKRTVKVDDEIGNKRVNFVEEEFPRKKKRPNVKFLE